MSKRHLRPGRNPFFHICGDGELELDTSYTELPEFKVKCLINRTKNNSALLSFLCERYNALKRARVMRRSNQFLFTRETEDDLDHLEAGLSLCTDDPDPAYVQNYGLNKILISEMARHCKARGVRFMLVVPDLYTYLPGIDQVCKRIDSSYDENFFEDDMESFAKSVDVEYLGLQRKFRQAFERDACNLHWGFGHWNYGGHDLVARELFSKLVQVLRLDLRRTNDE